MRTVHRKLVRNGIPERLRATGVAFEARPADRGEMNRLLLAKLHEEADELASASSPTQVRDELADILEVVLSIARLRGFSDRDIEAAMLEKRADRGGFDAGLVLEWTDEP